MSDPNPLICGTRIMKPPPKRIPLLRWNAEVAKLVWDGIGLLVGLIISIPFIIFGIVWLTLTCVILGLLAGMVFGQVTYQGLPPHRAARRRARWTTRRKLAQPEGDKAAVYIGCCGPLDITHQTGNAIHVISGSRPATDPLSSLTLGVSA